MEIKINDRNIKFKIVPLIFEKNNYENVFFDKNNKTLKQTFEHEKYSRLKILLSDKYRAHLIYYD
jgi:hypothetical protein